jgi:hypothetical protein
MIHESSLLYFQVRLYICKKLRISILSKRVPDEKATPTPEAHSHRATNCVNYSLERSVHPPTFVGRILLSIDRKSLTSYVMIPSGIKSYSL